jgi:preprotein translocase subunit SecG
MGTFISLLIIIVSVLLILVVLIQNSKGGGLSSTFASSNQVMGVRKTADFLEKATWTLAIALLALCLVATPYGKAGSGDKESVESVTRKKAESNVNTAPTTPVAPPVGAPVGSAPAPQPAPAPSVPAPSAPPTK